MAILWLYIDAVNFHVVYGLKYYFCCRFSVCVFIECFNLTE